MSRNRVLVVEDDASIRDLIRVRLTAAGYDVHTARTGLEAVGRLAELRPRAVVLDINMPEMDGFGFLGTLQRNNIKAPVLVLTARHAAEDVRRAIKLGAKDYLTKPFNETQLVARVARLIRAPLPPPPRRPPPTPETDVFI
jgi:two-component system OmpR family response regulator